MPTLILFLVIGMLAGLEGFGNIHFDKPSNAQFIGLVSLNLFRWSGYPLGKRWTCITEGGSLSTLGVLVTALTLVAWFTDLSLLEGLLLGSIVSSTDAAAVFSILRSKNTGLKGELRSTLELESGNNDPMAFLPFL